MKVTLASPVAVEVPPEVIEADVPPRLTLNAELAAKPEPEIVTDDPTLLLGGLGAPNEDVLVTVYVVCAVTPEVSVAKIVFAPSALGGTVNVADQLPLVATVGAAGLVVTGVPANETFTVSVGM